MTITRVINGKEEIIELTPAEMRLASQAYEEECHKEDVEGKLKEILITPFALFTEDNDSIVFKCDDKEKSLIDNATWALDKALGKNDSFWESFWFSVEDVINEEMYIMKDDSKYTPESVRVTIKDDKTVIRIYSNEELVAKYNEGEVEIYNLEFFASRENRNQVDKILNKLWY